MHGDTGTPLYKRWIDMRVRCNNPACKAWPNYGGRGIAVCSAWASYTAFKEWAISAGFAPELQLDRIDNDLGYSPENCRWVTQQENLMNRRWARKLVLYGVERTLADVAREYGMHHDSLYYRIVQAGWTPEDAVETPIARKVPWE